MKGALRDLHLDLGAVENFVGAVAKKNKTKQNKNLVPCSSQE